MRLNKIMQFCFKLLVQKIFLLIHGKIKEYNESEKLNFKKQKIEIINLKNNVQYKVANQIYEIPNGRVYTDSVEHVAIIKNKIIIPGISYQQIKGELKTSKFNKVLSTGTPRLIKNINGKVLSLVQGSSGNNYFHFLYDIIAKIKLCEEKYSLSEIYFFYVPNNLDWQKKILSAFGIESSKLINSQIYRHISAKNLIVSDHPWYKKGYVQTEIYNTLPEWILFWLRDKFLNLSKKFVCSDKIFIDRSESKSNHCKLINNDEVIKYLSNNGFKSYQVGKLDFFEQIYLFKQAKTIIGPHGAAFSNIVFSSPGTNLIEIIPEDHPSKKCEKFSKILNINYTRVKRPKIYNLNNNSGDMKIDTSEIEKIIEKL